MKSLSIREIAKLADCSVSTVSNVLNAKEGFFSEETRQRVMKVVRENNYISNSAGRNLRKMRHHYDSYSSVGQHQAHD